MNVLAVYASPRKNGNSAKMLHAFFLRHRMILGGSGALGYGLESINDDDLAIRDSRNTGKRLVELYRLVHGSGLQK